MFTSDSGKDHVIGPRTSHERPQTFVSVSNDDHSSEGKGVFSQALIDE
jgi:hypothetical protein